MFVLLLSDCLYVFNQLMECAGIVEMTKQNKACHEASLHTTTGQQCQNDPHILNNSIFANKPKSGVCHPICTICTICRRLCNELCELRDQRRLVGYVKNMFRCTATIVRPLKIAADPEKSRDDRENTRWDVLLTKMPFRARRIVVRSTFA